MASARPPRQVADSLVDYLASEIVAYYDSQDVVPPTAALDAIGEREERAHRAPLHSLRFFSNPLSPLSQ